MNVLDISPPRFPDTFWAFSHVLRLVEKRSRLSMRSSVMEE